MYCVSIEVPRDDCERLEMVMEPYSKSALMMPSLYVLGTARKKTSLVFFESEEAA